MTASSRPASSRRRGPAAPRLAAGLAVLVAAALLPAGAAAAGTALTRPGPAAQGTGHAELTGTLVAGASEDAARPGQDVATELGLRTAGDRVVALPLDDRRLAGRSTGDRLRITHRAARASDHLTSADIVGVAALPAGERRRAEPAPLIGPHEVTVVLLTVDGRRDATTTAELSAAVTGPLNDYYRRLTDGAVTFHVRAVHEWTDGDVTSDSGACRPLQLMPLAQRLDPGLLESGNRHVLFYMADNDACSFAGNALLSDGDGQLLLNGTLSPSTVQHELAHNLGLGHSSLRVCSSDGNPTGPGAVPDAASCSHAEYRDPYDVMGHGTGHLNAAHLHTLGIAPKAGFPRVATDTRLRLAPLAARGADGAVPAGAVRGALLPVGRTTYYLEMRNATGLDAEFRSRVRQPLTAGVLVHRVEDAWRGSFTRSGDTEVLDFTPGDLDSTDAPLPPGQPWTSPDGRLTLSVQSVDASGADVVVTRVPDTTPPPAPTLEIRVEGGRVLADVTGGADADSGLAAVELLHDGQVVERVERLAADPSVDYGVTVPFARGADGRHTVVARAVDVAGNASTSPARTYTVDAVRPTVTAPRLGLQRGALRAASSGQDAHTGVPVALAWGASDAVGICTQQVQRTPNPPGEQGLARVPGWGRGLSAHALAGRGSFTVTAADCAGNSTSVARSYSAAVVDDAAWRVVGAAGRAAQAGAWRGGEIRLRAGGRAEVVCRALSCGLVATTGPGRGVARVLVDGREVARVDLRGSATRVRQQVWTASWSTVAARRVTVLPASSAPVAVDALTALAP